MSGCYYYRAGDLFGALYVFDKAGEGIKEHIHAEVDRRHNVIVLAGSVRLNGLQLTAGGIALVDHDRPHEIVALEDGTQILNLNLHGCPAGWEESQHGQYAGPVDQVACS